MRFGYYDDLIKLNGPAWTQFFEDRSDERTTYDVIVIGSGMGGGILADATSDAGLKTLVLEAGPIRHLVNVTDLPVPNKVESFDPYLLGKDTRLDGGVSFNLGGRSIFWSAVIPRMKGWELQHWPGAIQEYLASGAAYYDAEVLMRKRCTYPVFQDSLVEAFENKFTDFAVSNLPRSLHQPGSGQNRRPGSPDERSTGVFSTAALLADSLMHPGKTGSDNLFLALEHIVESIQWDAVPDESGRHRATSVSVIDIRNRRRRVFLGKTIVLAGGTTESARLALTSKLADKSNKIGIGLTDHAEAELHFDVPYPWSFGADAFTADDQGHVFLRARDEPRTPNPPDLFSCELALNHRFWDVRIEDDDVWKAAFRKKPAGSAGAGKPAFNSTIKFLFRTKLNENNRVELIGDQYQVTLEKLTPTEETFAKARTLAEDLLTFLKVAPKHRDELTVNPSAVTFHLGGSLRMGESAATSVVDTDLRFHQYSNLYCCDLSVFPDIPASNPSLTLATLAQRLAKHLSPKIAPATVREQTAARGRTTSTVTQQVERQQARVNPPVESQLLGNGSALPSEVHARRGRR